MRQRNSSQVRAHSQTQPGVFHAGAFEAAGPSNWTREFGAGLTIGFRRLLRAVATPLVPTDALGSRHFFIMAAGRQLLSVDSARGWNACRLRSGQVLVLRPSEACVGRDHRVGPAAYWWIRLSADDTSPLPGMSETNGRRLRAMLADIRRRSFTASGELLSSLARLSQSTPTSGTLADLSLESALQTLLVQLVNDAHAPPPTRLAPGDRRAFRHAVTLIAQDLAEPRPWEEIARRANYPSTKLWQLFKDQAGLSPTEYLNARRIQHAIRLLREGRLTNTQVAHALGFSTSQYFAVVFRRLKGMTPTDFVSGLHPHD